MPKVSIILTSYNHEKYICEAIDSVLAQTFSDFELIIWDDASKDSSWCLISQYQDTRIKTFRNEINLGPVYGINKAISEIAVGDYIAIHHSDDVWELNKLEQQVEFLNTHQGIGAVFSNAQAITEEGLPLSDESHFYSDIFQQQNRTRHEWLRLFFMKGNALCHPSILIRKTCYQQCGLYRPMLAQVPDCDMWIRLCLRYEIHVLPEKLVRFRILNAEANTSGNRPDTRIRGVYEYYKLLSNYRNVTSIDELIKIFPLAEKYNKAENTNTQFALAMIALEIMPFAFTPLFGLEILLEILSDPKQAVQIKKYYQFDYLNFIELSSNYDVFSLEKINKLNQELIEVKTNIDEIQSSLSWKVTYPLRKLVRSEWFIAFRKNSQKIFWFCRNKLIFFKQCFVFNIIRFLQLLRLAPKSEVFHVAPPDNYCFLVPFDYYIKNDLKSNVAVVCHLYYDELLEEFKKYLNHIPFSFDLFITTDTLEKKANILEGLKNWQKGKVEVRIVANRGRDIAPKLVACHDVYEQYEFFLHIHSKKSPHAEDVTAGWRTYLLNTLLGSEQIVHSVFAAFMADEQLGMIAPEHFDPIRPHVGWGRNFVAASEFAQRLNMNLSLDGKIDFPSGSMFWGRSAALKPLLDLNLNTEDFPPEQKQIDATLAHLIERLYFFVCEKAGYRWIKIAQPRLIQCDDKMLSVKSNNELHDMIVFTQYRLL